MANTFKVKKLLAASGIFSSLVEAPNLVYNTGNQTISGIKNFTSRPTINGTGVLLSGEAATPQNLATTGSILNTKIDNLSGYSNNTFATITNLATTGSTLNTRINSLSGTLTSTYATIANLATTGSTLNTRINNLSGYINSTGSNIVFTTGNQTITGQKIFQDKLLVGLTTPDAATPDNILQTNSLTIAGVDLTAGGQVPSTVIKGGVFLGNSDGSVGLLTNSHSAWGPVAFEFAGVNYDVTAYNNMYFSAGYLPQFWLDTNGNVGIDTAYPTERLEVNGNVLANNLVYNTSDQSISGNKIFGINNISRSTESNAAILGGSNNTITGVVDDSFIANGSSNLISGAASDSFILNGLSNKIFNFIGTAGRPFYSYISNGLSNLISGGTLSHSFISAGNQNKIESSSYSYIANGQLNRITGFNSSLHSTILGGSSNTIQDGNNASILNGASNFIGDRPTGTDCSQGCYSSIINGSNNKIIGAFNIIGGGSFNEITGGLIFDTCCQTSSKSNVILGGANNSIKNSSCSAILGGRYNEVIHNGATIIGDGSLNIKTSRGSCTLLMSFANGIFLESPTVNYNEGTVNLSGSSLNFYGVLETGATVTVTQANNAVTQTIDVVSDEVELTRGSAYVLYNPIYDSEGVANPYATAWNRDGWSDLSNLQTRTYSDLYNGEGNFGNLITGTELIMRDMAYDKYYKVLFSAWQQGADGSEGYRGFSYTRTEVTFTKPQINGTGVGGNLDFDNRPSVSGIGVLLIGEAGQVPDTVVQTSGTQTISGSKTFTNVTEFFSTLNISSQTINFPLNSEMNFILPLTTGITGITFSNTPTNTFSFTLRVDYSGAHSIIWPTGTPSKILWPSSTAPTLTSVSGKKDFFTFVTYNSGAEFFGFNSSQNF